MINERTILPLQTHSIYPVLVEGLDLHYKPALSPVSDTSNVAGFWIFTSVWFLPNDPLSSDDIVDWDNDSMLGIGGGDTNID